MSIISMTGFGKSESTLNGTTCVIEVRSVNSRFLEISSKIPKNFAYLENDLKAIVKDKLVRGSVNLTITLGEGAVGNIPVCYNEAAVAKFVEITKAMQAKYGIDGDIKLEHVLAIPEVLQFTDAGADNEAWAAHLKNELSKALDGVIAMREKEGANLAADLTKRVAHLEDVLAKIEVLDPQRIETWKVKFKERVDALMKDSEIDDVRLLQEQAGHPRRDYAVPQPQQAVPGRPQERRRPRQEPGVHPSGNGPRGQYAWDQVPERRNCGPCHRTQERDRVH